MDKAWNWLLSSCLVRVYFLALLIDSDIRRWKTFVSYYTSTVMGQLTVDAHHWRATQTSKKFLVCWTMVCYTSQFNPLCRLDSYCIMFCFCHVQLCYSTVRLRRRWHCSSIRLLQYLVNYLVENWCILRVPTHRESQGESGKIREWIWSGKVGEFCWWSWNFGSLRTKTAIFVCVSGHSLMQVHSVCYFLYASVPFHSQWLNVVMIAQEVGVGEEEMTKM